MRDSFGIALLAGIILVFAGCRPQVRAIHVGEDTCAHCMMTISDERFASQMVTRTGSTRVFDSIECMAAFLGSADAAAADVHSLWVTDFAIPGRMIRAEGAGFLRSDQVPSPMGLNFLAFGETRTARQLLDSFGGKTLSWTEVRKLAESSGADQGSVALPAAHHRH